MRECRSFSSLRIVENKRTLKGQRMHGFQNGFQSTIESALTTDYPLRSAQYYLLVMNQRPFSRVRFGYARELQSWT